LIVRVPVCEIPGANPVWPDDQITRDWLAGIAGGREAADRSPNLWEDEQPVVGSRERYLLDTDTISLSFQHNLEVVSAIVRHMSDHVAVSVITVQELWADDRL
jgi:hypothetical protein